MDFKFKCVGYKNPNGFDDSKNFLIGNVYKAVNGVVIDERNESFTAWSITGRTFEELQSWFEHWYEFEFVEEILPEPVKTNDPVNHPSHYTKGKIEVADFIADQKLNFDRGNAVKYVCRAGSKDPEKEIQDLEKAIWYIKHEIKMLKGEDADAVQKEN